MIVTTSKPARTFSIVSAVYNVDRYLNDFLSSLERQSHGIENLDIVLVDDGSTDASLATLQRFAEKHPQSVRVLTKVNGGQASARNLGLDYARGEWVTFTDPDDFLDADFFEVINKYLDRSTSSVKPEFLATALTSYYETTGLAVADHPLNDKFILGSRTIDLSVEIDRIHLHGSSTLFNRALVEERSIRFDERVRPNFEDGHFIARYLLRAESDIYAVVPQARYNYRKRADESSTLSISRSDPRRFVEVPRHGFLAVLEEAVALRGSVPLWLQNVILYDLAWYLRAEESPRPPSASLTAETLDEFQTLLLRIRPLLSDALIRSFSIIPISEDIRYALLRGFTDEAAVSDAVRSGRADRRAGMAELSYRYTGEAPRESIYSGSTPIVPAHTKSRAIRFYGKTVGHERIIWIPVTNRVSIHLNGVLADIGPNTHTSRNFLTPESVEGTIARALNSRPGPVRDPHESVTSRVKKSLRKSAGTFTPISVLSSVKWSAFSVALHSPSTRRKFANAWVFADSQNVANDNAEHLYRYTQRTHPEINAWFLLDRDSADWDRLKQEGFRLVAYGSLEWQMLMLNADNVLSAHSDQFILNPRELRRFGTPRWRFIYLRHGVMANDMSNWLNKKRIDMLVASSPAEYDAIVSEGSPYKFSTKEVRLTGLPRHDLLRQKRESTPEQERSHILVMPTWRNSLVKAHQADSEAGLVVLRESRYVTEFATLMNSEALRATAEKHNATIVFVPHPKMATFVDLFNVPAHVSVKTFAEHNVQDLLARAAVVITDYSSLAFEAAVVEAPVVYYQFDKDEVFSGAHTYREGHYSYERDGFGPVCTVLDEVETAVDTLLTAGDLSEYHERMRAAFAHHDQNNSKRVIEAVLALSARAH